MGDTVFAILEDRAGDFWLSSNRGIARITREGLAQLDAGADAIEPTWFGRADGMLSQQGNGASQTPAWRARDDTLWFGTTNGVVMVDPAHLRRNLLPPPVAIEHVLADGGEFDPGQPVHFGADADHLEFHYAGMSYVAPEAVRYRYRLEGYDEQWVDAGARRVAYYTNLPPRDYVFRAAACNNDGIWSTQDATFAFTILPHWYETRAFRLFAPIGLLLLLAGAYRVRLWRVRANERVLLREVALRTRELRSANAELHRLASLDGLTRIGNRGAFEQGLARAWEDHRVRGVPLAVLLCDIDVFKAYNDSCGHQAGDAALIRVAGAMADMVRSADDLAARYGGEELALLLADCDAHAAAVIAQRLLEAVRALAIEHRVSHVAPWVTISIGHAALVPRAGQSADLIVRLADEALYRAKAQGRDRVCGSDGQ
jgi:diguanylate cyclase (GGDEF)-like protein